MTTEGTLAEVLSGEARWCVICADALSVLPTLADGCVDAVVTDPPYGIGFAYQPTKWQRRAGKKSEDWDNNVVDLSAILRIGSIQCVWGGNYYALPPSRGWLVWTKPDSPPSMGDAEFAWTNQDTTARHLSHSISATNRERTGHPTQKPLRVMEWTLRSLPPADLILDPFCGSGTTGVAALRLGRRVILIEREPRWADLSRERLRAEERNTTLAAVRAGQMALFGG